MTETDLVASGMRTYSGASVDVGRLDHSQIRLVDISWGLSHTNRYAGQANRPYSVAGHCLALVDYLRSIGRSEGTLRYALMHDASEYLLGDLPRPVKRILPQYVELEKHVSSIILKRYGIDGSQADHFKQYDLRICVDEMQQFNLGWKHDFTEEPLGINLRKLRYSGKPEFVHKQFLDELHVLKIKEPNHV